MTRHAASEGALLGAASRDSFSRLAIADGLVRLGTASVLASAIGASDDWADAAALGLTGASALALGLAGRRTFVRRRQPATARVLSGMASTWAIMVLFGTATYVFSGAISTVDGALFESAAGFSTVALTTLDPSELSLSVALFRGATQWLGGLLGLTTVVVALPRALRGLVQTPKGEGRSADRLVPTTRVGSQRVFRVYAGLTAACFVGYAAAGMPLRGAAIHAMTTVSTGGFSDNADSFATEGGPARVVATFFMIVAGMSFFALFWLLRGNHRRFLASPELRLYVAIIASVTTMLVLDVEGLSVGDALFTAASASSTTGHAVVDWTLFPAASLALLLVAVATGAMGASAGSGLRVVRAWMLVLFAGRELRRQLDPNAVIVVKHANRPLNDAELDHLTGYQIAHFGLCAVGSFLLAVTGAEILDAIWAAISVLSTAGPSLATTAFGDAGGIDRVGRLVLIPGMLAGRLSILPLLLAVASLLQAKDLATRQLRRFVRPDQ